MTSATSVRDISASGRILLRDVQGSEGPLVTRDGRVFLVEPERGRLLECLGEGEAVEFAVTGGIPAGLQLHRDGSLWVADMTKGILRVGLDGSVENVVTEFDGRPIRGCNDCYFDSSGHLYFTAPAGSSAENPAGELFCRRADGQVMRLDGGFAFCNGLAVSADGRTLIVAETWTKSLWAYEIEEPGVVSGRRLWAVLPGDHVGGPDGIDFDGDGRLIATNWGAGVLEIYDADGRHETSLRLPFSRPSNVHFRGPGSTELLVTEHEFHGLWQFSYGRPGQLQFGWQT